ncbi:MAG: exodeoxyribonuclease VII small subunit [Bdellovibrionaceae bacterium]|nr:exodeoxyribonuclease VII small subunit [Bdellovibrionales bacterium]MCB9086193.1 exodeoxyribonuclease VII small subunit [Pseudobdellovibrionaceae bacterium]
MSFEKKLGRLEAIVKEMEGGEMSLEKSLKAFEEGVQLARECHGQLNEAEQKVKVLLGVDSEGNLQTKDFEVKE